MASPLDRRTFLKTALVAGATLPVALRGAMPVTPEELDRGPLRNRFFSVSFEEKTGLIQVWRADGAPFLSNAIVRAVTAGGTRHTSDPDYRRSTRLEAVQDSLGAGRRLIAKCVDTGKRLDFEIHLTLYNDRDALVVEAFCRNPSGKEPITVRSLHPIHVAPEEGSALFWPGVRKVLTNGRMYYDAGAVRDFQIGGEASGWWNIGYSRGDREPGLVVGYVENNSGMGFITTRNGAPKGGAGVPDGILLDAESLFANEFVLKPGASVSSDRLIFNVASNPFTALETYAQAMADVHKVRLNPIINGWCTWSYAYGAFNEDEVIRQAEFAAKHLKPYGFEYMQLDDGFYRALGDWEGNEKFPHGMKWMADKIREIGLKPGIWLAPFAIASGAKVFHEHPEWLIHNPDGTLKSCGPEIADGSERAKEPNPQRCGLDITHPGAAQWLSDLFKTATHDWGYDLVKIDFVDWTLLSADRYWDPTVTRAAAYRKGIGIMRQAMGPGRHLLDCGPGPVSVGLLDSMRIELDQPPVNWNQYFLQSASTMPAMAKRYYFHGRTWINDADHIVLSPLTIPQAQAVVSLLALSGGTAVSGDRLTDLDPARLEILKKVYPSSGQAARPIDLFDSDRPCIFALPVKKKFGEWTVLGIFNTNEKERVEKRVSLDRLGLDTATTYVGYDFWRQRLHGEITGELVATLEPASVLLLAIHEKQDRPFVISTDRHVTQGLMDLEDVVWNAETSVLKGVSLGPVGTSHRVYIHLPKSTPVVPEENSFYFHDYPGYTTKLIEPNILRVQVRFEQNDSVAWEVNMKALNLV